MACGFSNLEENTVKYLLFPKLGDINENSLYVEALEVISESYVTRLSPLLSRYIWQNDTFNLYPICDMSGVPPHLKGVTTFDDNIEDEWFVVYLLFFLSRKDPHLVIKVEDNDGEFLLIEAADHVPKWLNPETSANRVFIYQGSVHIIPIPQNPSEVTTLPSGSLSVSDAVSFIRQFPSFTKASPDVQQVIQSRIQGYPKKIEELQHKAHCYVPASLAALLKDEPRLLSTAVKAFYYRDPLDMKACTAMKYFPPETRVMTEVLFTRCLYAQLISQKFEPDRRTGWDLPGVNTHEFKAHDLGMKLACGFEILVSKTQKQKSVSDENLTDVNVSNDARWKRFVKSLKDRGYFRGELEGSKLYDTLFRQAKDFYLNTLKQKDSNITPGAKILKLLETLNVNYEELKNAEQSLSKPDDDSWMEISPDELDRMLNDTYSKKMQESISTVIPKSLKTFLHHSSDVDGVEFPTNDQKKKQKINLDADAFAEAVSNILDFRVPESDDECSSSSMSGYSDDEDDLQENNLKESNSNHKLNKKKTVLDEMAAYMEQMDRELAQTNVGLSFEKAQPCPNEKHGKQENSNLLESDIDEEEDEFRPVDVNLTALKNILESYSSQQGLPGPASNLLNSMGVNIPHNMDTDT